jgi:CheY-like chemotaxis protein
MTRKNCFLSRLDSEIVHLAFSLWRAKAFEGGSPEDALLAAARELKGKLPTGKQTSFLVPKPLMKAILLIQDKASAAPTVGRLLHVLRDYWVVQAENAEEALQMFATYDRHVNLLIADVALPTMSGTDIALSLRSRNPALSVILTTGHSLPSRKANQDGADFKTIGLASVTILERPFDAKRLLNAVHALIGVPDSLQQSSASGS